MKTLPSELAFETKLKAAHVPKLFRKELYNMYPNNFQKGKIPKNKGAFLYGPAGSGKTLKAISLALDNFDSIRDIKDNSFMFGNVNEILFQIKQTYRSDFKVSVVHSENNMTAEEFIIHKYSKPDFLVLDDLGVEKTTEFTNQTLYLIINRRYENEKVTFVTSNLPPEELEKKMEDGRIISRLLSNAVLIHMAQQYRNK